ncbi:hypothetical protein HaLaN_06533 [Haematococcus lacustris]|uniref:Uncharacterized protein n=1 Tax=Haematococcus lacustris TaxID=44745 RepID=A0A699YP67_HAELA|nr:hypothetical protein HaLaN_06533 [Haematococcus lacustris]
MCAPRNAEAVAFIRACVSCQRQSPDLRKWVGVGNQVLVPAVGRSYSVRITNKTAPTRYPLIGESCAAYSQPLPPQALASSAVRTIPAAARYIFQQILLSCGFVRTPLATVMAVKPVSAMPWCMQRKLSNS